MQIRIEAVDLPGLSCGPGPDAPDGHHHVHVGVQRRNRPHELFGLVAGNSPTARWTLECATLVSPSGVDLKGPHIQGPPGSRFIYLSWVDGDATGDPVMFRRAKLWLDAIAASVLERAVHQGALIGRLGLTDPAGNPLCASVRPPLIEWSTGASE